MKNKNLISLIAISLIAYYADAQQLFTSQLQDSNLQMGGTLATCSDGGVAITGVISSGNQHSLVVSKFSSSGLQEWSKHICKSVAQYAFETPKIISTVDSGFIIAAREPFNDSTYVIKVNKTGAVLGFKNFFFSTSYKMLPTTDGGYLFASAIKWPSGNCLSIKKLDVHDNITWTNDYTFTGIGGNSGSVNVSDICRLSNGDYSILMNHNNAITKGIVQVRISSNGTLLYEKKYSDINTSITMTGIRVCEIIPNTATILFSSVDALTGQKTAGKFNTNSTGNITSASFAIALPDTSMNILSACAHISHNTYFAGTISNNGFTDSWVMQVDSNNALSWGTILVQPQSNEYSQSIAVSSTGPYLGSYKESSGMADLILLSKLNFFGHSSCPYSNFTAGTTTHTLTTTFDTLVQSQGAIAYNIIYNLLAPIASTQVCLQNSVNTDIHPQGINVTASTGGVLIVQAGSMIGKYFKFAIFDVQGRLVWYSNKQYLDADKIMIDIGQLANGIYVLRAQNDLENYSSKFLKER